MERALTLVSMCLPSASLSFFFFNFFIVSYHSHLQVQAHSVKTFLSGSVFSIGHRINALWGIPNGKKLGHRGQSLLMCVYPPALHFLLSPDPHTRDGRSCIPRSAFHRASAEDTSLPALHHQLNIIPVSPWTLQCKNSWKSGSIPSLHRMEDKGPLD